MKNGFMFVDACIITAVFVLLVAVAVPTYIRAKQHYDANKTVLESPTVQAPTNPYKTVIIEGCEYIEIKSYVHEYAFYSLCHKGNCTNSNGHLIWK